ncbi:Fc.00g026320.m01.CDS01 [Cosmosporella sp. VM-42]
MAMGSDKFPSPEDLLQFHPDYSILICKSCRYAIQPSGVARHLKEIHRIYRSRRRPYLEFASRFKLAKTEDVIQADILEFPVQALPVVEGLQCLASEGCDYLCASTKRMQNHWLSTHGRNGTAANGDWRVTPLQTFFRGNLLHYFTDPMSGITTFPSSSAIMDDFDKKLLRHYLTSTSMTFVDRQGSKDIWQQVIPRMAGEHAFLMHALLACSALHAAKAFPSKRQFYLVRAHNHQDIAMPLYRQVSSNVTKSNCHAIIAFAHLLVIYSFAANLVDERLFLVGPTSAGSGMMSSWLYFIRNGCFLVGEFWDDIENGPLGIFVNVWEAPMPTLGDPATYSGFKSLMPGLASVLERMNVEEAWEDGVLETCSRAADQLAKAFVISKGWEGSDFTTWDAIRVWPMDVSSAYIGLLSKGHPGAVVLLSHYSVLLEDIQCHWYFQDGAKRLLNTTFERLEPKWHIDIWESIQQVREHLKDRRGNRNML